jgi:predicted Zn finger-like uncharacterized protein
MRIVCPGCAAAYEVPANRLSPRKMVRCARCGCEWVAVQEAEADASDEANPDTALAADPAEPGGQRQPALPAITAMDRLAAAEPKRARSAGLLIAWALTFVILAGGAAAVVVWRAPVVHAWPAAGRILGAAANPPAGKIPESGHIPEAGRMPVGRMPAGHIPGASASPSAPAHAARESE